MPQIIQTLAEGPPQHPLVIVVTGGVSDADMFDAMMIINVNSNSSRRLIWGGVDLQEFFVIAK
jgi:hypothetical protein